MAGSNSAHTALGAARPSEAEVREQLGRILSSPEFDVPERVRKFLEYVVEEALAGRAERLKAYSIAVEVFGRDPSFDAQSDPVVRIEASRVRRALERYYLTAGRTDPLVVAIPKGGYAPTFACPDRDAVTADAQPDTPPPLAPMRWAGPAAAVLLLLLALFASDRSPQAESPATPVTAPAVSSPDVPEVIVMPFADLSGTPRSAVLARGLTDEVIAQMARFREIVVVAGRSGEADAVRQAGAAYHLEGGLRAAPEGVRLTVRLVDATRGTVLWAESYEARPAEAELAIASEVATTIAQSNGVLSNAGTMKLTGVPPADREGYACTLDYYAYRTDLDPAEHASVRSCLERAVERFPEYATAWALLSLVYLDELRFRYPADAGAAPPLDRALSAARRAVELDPRNVRGLQAQMTALFFVKDVDAALAIGTRALSLNPNDTELAGEYGLRLALSGDWRRGGEIIEAALDRNAAPAGYYETALALCFSMQGDDRSATRWIRKANASANPVHHLVAAAVFGRAGDTAAAAEERAWLLRNAMPLLNEVRGEMDIRNMRPEDQARFVEGLRKAGLEIVGF